MLSTSELCRSRALPSLQDSAGLGGKGSDVLRWRWQLESSETDKSICGSQVLTQENTSLRSQTARAHLRLSN